MSESNPPSFEEWVEYCFIHRGHMWHSGDDDAVPDPNQRFDRLGLQLVTYLTRLLECPGFLAERYTPDQIAKAMWFIFSSSWYIDEVRFRCRVPDDQIRCIRSVATLYTDLLDRVCGDWGRDPDTDLRDSSDIDGAVYMIWDMNNLEGTVMFPEKHPHLLEPGLFVLETVLRKCRTSACLVSALHGIGHCCGHARSNGNRELMARLQSLVDGLVSSRELPAWLLEYSGAARDGYVQ